MKVNETQQMGVSSLERKLEDKTAVVGIVGLGYVGLPLAVTFAQAGLKVIGFDLQVQRVTAVNRGESYISDVSDQTLSAVATLLTFWPPGPEARTKYSWISLSSIAMVRVMRIMSQVYTHATGLDKL